MERLNLSAARRVALAAQGFGKPRPTTVTGRHVAATIDRVAQFQIDSISVAVRAHQMPLFSRLGPYDRTLLLRAAERAPRRLFEYWGHAASLIDVGLQPALRPRMANVRDHAWRSMVRIAAERPGFVEQCLAQVAARGPLSARQIENAEIRDRTNWGWNWSSVKTALEWLFYSGQVAVAARNPAFERLYDLPERVLPAAVLAQPTPEPAVAERILVRRAARALGIGTAGCLADYFRLPVATARRHAEALVEAGELRAVEVPGWSPRAYLDSAARRPRHLDVSALTSPFDSLNFERSRLEGLFGCRYRVEIYVPAAKREFGYYVYLFWLGEQVAARVDLKADRASGSLLVQAAWRDPACSRPFGDIAAPLAVELESLAGWLGLTTVRPVGPGDLAPALSGALG